LIGCCEMFFEDPARYGELWADIYDTEHVSLDTEGPVAFLAELGRHVRVLELGVGTGRVALALASRGIDIVGIDASEAMVSRLRRKPGGEELKVTIGDMASTPLGGPFGLVFVVFNTFFGLMTQERQVQCFVNVARSLSEGGRFVLECFVPDVARFSDESETVRAVSVEDDLVRLEASVHDPVNQQIRSQIVFLGSEGIDLRPVSIRYVWPAELDLMARLAGLELEDRYGGWGKEPFSASSICHVSVYRRP